jgi:uncharacterized coiled-coil protein SlyX
MPHFSKAMLLFACLCSVAGCDRPSPHAAATKNSSQDPIARDVENMEAEVRISAATKRIDELERQVGELQSTPEKLDLELLTNRVTALEASQTGITADPDASSTNATPVPLAVPAPLPRANGSKQTSPKRSSSLKLPELEARPRVATPDETKSFTRAK